MNDNEYEKKCKHCEHCRRVYAQNGWSIVGCFHEPYRGKWIAEIKECPKEGAK